MLFLETQDRGRKFQPMLFLEQVLTKVNTFTYKNNFVRQSRGRKFMLTKNN